jgi:hypothetical protein
MFFIFFTSLFIFNFRYLLAVADQARRSNLFPNRQQHPEHIANVPSETFNGDESSDLFHSDEEDKWADDSASEYDERRSPAQIFHTRFHEPDRFTRREITCVLSHLQRGWTQSQARALTDEPRMWFFFFLCTCVCC